MGLYRQKFIRNKRTGEKKYIDFPRRRYKRNKRTGEKVYYGQSSRLKKGLFGRR